MCSLTMDLCTCTACIVHVRFVLCSSWLFALFKGQPAGQHEADQWRSGEASSTESAQAEPAPRAQEL